MIHARTLEAAEKIVVEMSETVGVKDYRILFSSREFKKERVEYLRRKELVDTRIYFLHVFQPY